MTKADFLLSQNIKNILNNGTWDKNPRPKYSDGTPAHTLFVNHVMRQYHINKGEFPICTLRPQAWKSAIKEILWIYQDQSNSLDILRNKYKIKYWDEWESNDIPGTIGQRYGATVKKYNLLDNLIYDIKNDPYGRRHIMNMWQEEDFKETDGLKPCCYETIWNVRDNYLDMLLVQRSGDMLTASGAGGVNEIQYASLLMMIAKATGYTPGIFTHIVANEQIYDRHIEAAKELLNRVKELEIEDGSVYKYKFDNVEMKFDPKSNDFYEFSINDFELVNYEPMLPQLTLELGI